MSGRQFSKRAEELVADALSELDPADWRSKSVFTTGEVADICRISQQTVIRCFDSGKLHGFRVPGSKFRRIPREALLHFMRDHDIPLEV
ncbi:MAG TPA: helix-turn-helix domain-containing protein, partial [Phycisphaerae bacterium]|nr:helix-turn-helix domain-containing protein [Phycisphaerae bacterium]